MCWTASGPSISPRKWVLDQVLAAYAALPEVEEVRAGGHLQELRRLSAQRPVPGTGQYYLRNITLGGGDIRAVGGWTESLGDTNIVICILDSGVDWHHPDLGGDHPDKVNGAIWTNWTEYYGTPGLDDDGNGKIDDYPRLGLRAPASPALPGQDVQTEDNDPMDWESHGTNCAGCGRGHHQQRHRYRRRGARLQDHGHSLRLDHHRCPGRGAHGLRRLRYHLRHQQRRQYHQLQLGILLGPECRGDLRPGRRRPDHHRRRQRRLRNRSLIPERPDRCAGCGRYRRQRCSKADFSNYGTWVELSAPGVAIYTTAYVPDGDQHTYASVQGTSFSSPLACGAAALLWSAHPTWPWSTIASLLTTTCDNIDAVNPGYDGLLGAGRVNLQKALGRQRAAVPGGIPHPLRRHQQCAVAEDTVKVESSVMINSPLTLHGRGIKFFGGYGPDYMTRDLENAPTVITGNIAQSTLRFQGDVGTDTEVDGFRITGGGGVVFGGIPYFGRYGGGIMLNATSPTLRNLDITGNSVGDDLNLGCGGGIMINGSSPILENVSIHGNTGVFGAGLFAYNSDFTMINCDISDNNIITTNASNPPQGGGMHVLDSTLEMTDCVVSGHQDVTKGGGMFVGAYNSGTTLNMTGGEISGNTVTADGGGLYFNGGSLNMTGVTVDNNVKTAAATFSHGGGIFATVGNRVPGQPGCHRKRCPYRRRRGYDQLLRCRGDEFGTGRQHRRFLGWRHPPAG